MTLKDANEVSLGINDQFLLDVFEGTEAQEKIQNTVNILQHCLCTVQPACLHANLGGEQGLKLSRAAFAVLLKFTDNIKEFEALIEDAEKIRQE